VGSSSHHNDNGSGDGSRVHLHQGAQSSSQAQADDHASNSRLNSSVSQRFIWDDYGNECELMFDPFDGRSTIDDSRAPDTVTVTVTATVTATVTVAHVQS